MPTADELREGDVRELAMDAIRALDAAEKEVERLRRYEALAEAWGAHRAAEDALVAHSRKRPELASPISPDLEAWLARRTELEDTSNERWAAVVAALDALRAAEREENPDEQ